MNWKKVTKMEKTTIHKWYLVDPKYSSGTVSTFSSMKPKFPFLVDKKMFWDKEHFVQEDEEHAFIKESSSLLSLLVKEIIW